MANEVVPFQVSTEMQAYLADKFGVDNTDLTEGVMSSFGIVSFKGKVWRVKYKGEEQIVKTADGDPAPSLVAVIVRGSPQISKIFYPGAYTEGDNEAPDCYSMDGVKPDPNSAKPQAPSCAACPHNVWGSKITEQGNKTKACADSRRLAVVPYPDLKNEKFGGPLLLRIPPASLQELQKYADQLKEWGMAYQAVVTKISFDMELAYPKLVFKAIGSLQSKEEADVVQGWLDGDEIGRMLSEAPIADGAPAPTQAEPAPEPTQKAAPEKKPAEKPKVVQMKPEPEPEKEPEPKATPKEQNSVEATPVEDGLNDLLGTLL